MSPMIVGGVMDSFNGDPTWAFVAFGSFCLPIAVWLWFSPPGSILASFFIEVVQKQESSHSGTVGLAEKVRFEEFLILKLVILFTSLFLLVYVGAEVSAGGYLFSYAVLKNLAGETESAFLTSGFWGALTLGRLLAVPGVTIN